MELPLVLFTSFFMGLLCASDAFSFEEMDFFLLLIMNMIKKIIHDIRTIPQTDDKTRIFLSISVDTLMNAFLVTVSLQ